MFVSIAKGRHPLYSDTLSGRTARGVGCDLVARAGLSASADEIAALKKAPGHLGGVAIGSKALTHADEQAIVGLAAVLKAIDASGLDPAGFDGWGVVASPRFMGRSAFDAAFPQFLNEGPWGVSPWLISSHSLHSVSGVVSQVLKAHGPNLGVAGTPGGEEQAMLAAAVMLAEGSAPGVWIVATGWNPGWDGQTDGDAPGVCEALALALTTPKTGWSGARLIIAPGTIRFETPNRRFDPAHPRESPPHTPSPAIEVSEPAEEGSRTHGG